MAAKNTAVFGIYPNRTAAEEATGHLRGAGFRITDVSVLFPENQGTKDLAHEKNTKAPEGFTIGAILGFIIGGVLGYLVAAGILSVPSLAPYTTAGPVVATLAAAGLLAILGGLIGALAGMSIPEYEARRFEGRIRDGGVLLSVHSDNREWTKRAKQVLEETGAQDIAVSAEKSGDFANADKPLPRVRTTPDVATPPQDPAYASRPATRVTPDVSIPTTDPAYTGRPMPRSRPEPAVGDELYTERVIRRRTIQDPEK
jgi:Protein of unknown function (DUF3341)